MSYLCAKSGAGKRLHIAVLRERDNGIHVPGSREHERRRSHDSKSPNPQHSSPQAKHFAAGCLPHRTYISGENVQISASSF